VRLANLDARPVLVVDGSADRVATIANDTTSGIGRSFDELFDHWDEVREWANAVDLDSACVTIVDVARLGPPSPNPRQVFAIGLNYAAHAAESGHPAPEHPTTFTKFPTCISGPFTTVDLPSQSVDYEIELVVVIGRRAHRVAAASAWTHVAGLMVGQDLSDRVVQLRPPAPQFSLGKSFPGFGPTGPWLVTADELANADDLSVSCRLNGELVQSSRTSDMIFSVSAIIEYVSNITPMLPGDLVFTGTPSGVGMGRVPPTYVRPGDVLESTIEQIGTIVTRFR
jgi:2-keto-4-pentenoate hydratase/2-oxohepta-3-ene-1,7-dioic acid hydratase in catechol pathway